LLTLYVVFYLVYLITGGVVFAALEAPEERAVKSVLARTRRIFLETHPCVSGTLNISLFEVFFFSDFPRLLNSGDDVAGFLSRNVLPHSKSKANPLEWVGGRTLCRCI
jgi:hypothetical protein